MARTYVIALLPHPGLVQRGVPDQAYDGRRTVVWQTHVARRRLLRVAGPHWRMDQARCPGLPVWPLADLLMAVSRVRRDGSCAGQTAPTCSDSDARRDSGPKRGEELVLTQSR
jgi:hypothetical protein